MIPPGYWVILCEKKAPRRVINRKHTAGTGQRPTSRGDVTLQLISQQKVKIVAASWSVRVNQKPLSAFTR